MPQFTETLTATVAPRHITELKQYAEDTGRSRSAALRWILDQSPQLQDYRQDNETEAHDPAA